jgi:predicted nucleic acid-binding protein
MRVEGERLVAPAILVAEASAALSRGMGDRQLAQRVIYRLMHSRLIELTPISLTLAQRAAEIAADYKIRGCDAVFVALAEQLGEELVTLDNEQLTRSTAVIAAKRP